MRLPRVHSFPVRFHGLPDLPRGGVHNGLPPLPHPHRVAPVLIVLEQGPRGSAGEEEVGGGGVGGEGGGLLLLPPPPLLLLPLPSL